MEVGSVEQSVEVTAAIPLLQTESASVGQVIEQAAVNALPLNGRNFVQLAILAPGVSGLDYAQSGTINTGKRPDELRPGGTAIQANGALSQSNQVLLDGIDNTEMISQTFIVRPAVEGIQEFKVITNNAGAEYGRSGWRGSGGDFQVGQQQLSRVAVRIPAQRTSGCEELLRASRRSQAALQAESVRRQPGRSGDSQQDLLLRELRRIPRGIRRHATGDGARGANPHGRFSGCCRERDFRSVDHPGQSRRERGHPRPLSERHHSG